MSDSVLSRAIRSPSTVRRPGSNRRARTLPSCPNRRHRIATRSPARSNPAEEQGRVSQAGNEALVPVRRTRRFWRRKLLSDRLQQSARVSERRHQARPQPRLGVGRRASQRERSGNQHLQEDYTKPCHPPLGGPHQICDAPHVWRSRGRKLLSRPGSRQRPLVRRSGKGDGSGRTNRRSVGGPASVHDEACACDECRGIARKIYDRTHQVLDLPDPAELDLGENGGLE